MTGIMEGKKRMKMSVVALAMGLVAFEALLAVALSESVSSDFVANAASKSIFLDQNKTHPGSVPVFPAPAVVVPPRITPNVSANGTAPSAARPTGMKLWQVPPRPARPPPRYPKRIKNVQQASNLPISGKYNKTAGLGGFLKQGYR